IVAFTAHKYLTGLPSGGNDLALIGICLAAGIALGLVGGLITRVFTRDGQTFVQAGPGAASLWVASMGARLAFIVWITHSAGGAQLAHFSLDHSITGAGVWQTALVVLALSEVIVRIATIACRAGLSHSATASTPSKADGIPAFV
ncbi:MAG: integral rane protein, partial [Pseudonocardiales bacterium]|nr:integral rane protein [Pseudonocardiales bacterium]